MLECLFHSVRSTVRVERQAPEKAGDRQVAARIYVLIACPAQRRAGRGRNPRRCPRWSARRPPSARTTGSSCPRTGVRNWDTPSWTQGSSIDCQEIGRKGQGPDGRPPRTLETGLGRGAAWRIGRNGPRTVEMVVRRRIFDSAWLGRDRVRLRTGSSSVYALTYGFTPKKSVPSQVWPTCM